MKTLQDLYDETKRDDALKGALVEAIKAGTAEDFLRQHDCDATADELEEFLADLETGSDALGLGDEDLMNVAGGTSMCCNITANTCGCTGRIQCPGKLQGRTRTQGRLPLTRGRPSRRPCHLRYRWQEGKWRPSPMAHQERPVRST